jgi:hypothetical protein
MPDQKSDLEVDRVLSVLESSRGGTRHAEIVTQTRLYNFLFCDSILILAWATVFSSDFVQGARTHVLVMLSGVSFLLGVAYAFLGHRACAFLRMHYDVDAYLETFVPVDFRLTTLTAGLQQKGIYICKAPNALGEEVRLWKLEKTVSGHFLIAVPASLASASMFLLVVSLGHTWLAWLVIFAGLSTTFAVLQGRFALAEMRQFTKRIFPKGTRDN